MKKLFVKFLLFFFILITGIYIALPLIIEQCAIFISKHSNYIIELHNFKNQFPHIEIEKIDIQNKHNQEKVALSQCSFSFSFMSLIKGEIKFQDLKILKIQKDNLILNDIKGKITANVFTRSVIGDLFSPLIKEGHFEVRFNKTVTAIVSGEVGGIVQENFGFDSALIYAALNKDQKLETNIVFKNAQLYNINIETLMLCATGQYLNNFNIKDGKVGILSSLLNVQGDFDLKENILSYKLFSSSELINFLGNHTLHFEGKYCLFDQKNNSLIKACVHNEKKMELIGKLDGSYLTFTPANKSRIKINLNPFSIIGEIDLTIKSFDPLTNIVMTQSDESVLNIKGNFTQDKYDFLLSGKKILLFSLLKASDLEVKLSGKRENGLINIVVVNKEKTNLNLTTNYVFDSAGVSFSKLFLAGNYRGTSIKTEKASLQSNLRDNIKGEILLNIGEHGDFFLKGDTQQFSLKAENIPIILLNNITKHQNILFKDGYIHINGSYIEKSQDFLDFKITASKIKSSLFGHDSLGQVNAHLVLKDGVLNSQAQGEWDGKTNFFCTYNTKNLSKIKLDTLYSHQDTSFNFKGDVMIDGFSDLFHMYDETFSGKVKIFAQKAEKEGITLTADMENGYFNHGFFNTEVKNITAIIRKDLKSPELNFLLKGKDKQIGTIVADGKCLIDIFKKHYDLQGKLDLNFFQWLNLEQYEGSGTGVLNFLFTPTEKKVGGHLKMDYILGYIVPKQEGEIIEIKIRSKDPFTPLKTKEEEGPDFDIIWDIHLNAKNNHVRFYGNGLDSFWNGDVHVGGTCSFPKLQGRIDASQGHFVLAGKKLSFIEGYLLCNNDMNPKIRVVAKSHDNNIDAKIIYHGILWNPKIDLVSIPSLPKEEIISQIMFGKSSSQLSAFQIIPLTDALAIFNSQNLAITSFLDKFQQLSGFDEIGIREDSISSLFMSPTADKNQSVLSAVKNLGSNAFIKLERSLSVSTPDSKTRGVIGLKIIPDLSVELIGEKPDTANTTSDGSFEFGVGIEWKKDF